MIQSKSALDQTANIHLLELLCAYRSFAGSKLVSNEVTDEISTLTWTWQTWQQVGAMGRLYPTLVRHAQNNLAASLGTGIVCCGCLLPTLLSAPSLWTNRNRPLLGTNRLEPALYSSAQHCTYRPCSHYARMLQPVCFAHAGAASRPGEHEIPSPAGVHAHVHS
jgi:hypothetical protein